MKLRKKLRSQLAVVFAVTIFSMSSCTATTEANAKTPDSPETLSAYCTEPAEIIDRRFVQPTDSPYKEEAEYAAKVIYGTARNHSAEDQKLVVWCIINRVEHSNYPESVSEVCQQSQQWMGYSDNNPVVKAFYEIALEEITQWHDGEHRLVPPEYIFLTWSSDDIVLKTTFDDNDKTCYWRSTDE